MDGRPAYRRRSTRAVALAALAAVLSSNAIALIDLAVFRHVTCAEHGEIIHADDHVMGAAPESEHYDAVSEAPVVAGHGHDHCVVTLLGRDETIATSNGSHLRELSSAAAVLVGGALASHLPLSTLDLAPKCSPPASAA